MSNQSFGAFARALPLHEREAGVISIDPFHRLEVVTEENILLRAVIDNFPGGLSLTDKNLRLVFCNTRLKEMLEYPPYLFEFGTPGLEQIFRFNALRGEYGPGNVDEQVKERMDLVRLRKPHVYQRVRPNGMVLEVRGVPLMEGGFMTTYLDVSDRRRAADAEAVEHYDQLTTLPKASLVHKKLNDMFTLWRPGQVAALHCMDLDHFRAINSRYGRLIGDVLIKQVASRLKRLIRDHDMVARIGGDRFLVVQSHVQRPSDVARLAHRILAEIRKPVEIDGQEIRLSSSIGLALAPRDGVDAKTLIARAEAAVMQTKTRNRGSFEESETTFS
jgi:diguanylate cyclase (GGDEF)-like protein